MKVLNKKGLIRLLIIISIFKLAANEKNTDLDKITINIIQKSKYDYEYIKDNRYLVDSFSIINALKDIPEAQALYKNAHYGYIGASVLVGFGIGITVLSSFFFIFSTAFIASSYKNFLNQNNLNTALGLSIGSSAGLCIGIPFIISGLFFRNENKLKEVEAINLYNHKKVNTLTFIPYLNIDKKLDVFTGIFIECKI